MYGSACGPAVRRPQPPRIRIAHDPEPDRPPLRGRRARALRRRPPPVRLLAGHLPPSLAGAGGLHRHRGLLHLGRIPAAGLLPGAHDPPGQRPARAPARAGRRDRACPGWTSSSIPSSPRSRSCAPRASPPWSWTRWASACGACRPPSSALATGPGHLGGRRAHRTDATSSCTSPTGATRVLRMDDGTMLGSRLVGERLDAGFVQLRAPAAPQGGAGLRPRDRARAGRARARSPSRRPRGRTRTSSTCRWSHPDPVLVPGILNEAGRALREKGAERVRKSARADIDFINERLDSRTGAARPAPWTPSGTSRRPRRSPTSRDARALPGRPHPRSSRRRWRAGTGSDKVLADLVRTMAGPGRGRGRPGLGSWRSSPRARRPRSGRSRPTSRPSRPRSDASSPRTGRARATRRWSRYAPRSRSSADQLADAAGASLSVVESRLQELDREQARTPRASSASSPTWRASCRRSRPSARWTGSRTSSCCPSCTRPRSPQAAASPYVEILDPAIGASRIQGRGRVNVFLGALLGLILGVGAAFFLEYLDRTVRTSSDVESLLGIPVLGVIPRLRRIEDAVRRAERPCAGQGPPAHRRDGPPGPGRGGVPEPAHEPDVHEHGGRAHPHGRSSPAPDPPRASPPRPSTSP